VKVQLPNIVSDGVKTNGCQPQVTNTWQHHLKS